MCTGGTLSSANWYHLCERYLLVSHFCWYVNALPFPRRILWEGTSFYPKVLMYLECISPENSIFTISERSFGDEFKILKYVMTSLFKKNNYSLIHLGQNDLGMSKHDFRIFLYILLSNYFLIFPQYSIKDRIQNISNLCYKWFLDIFTLR